MSNLYISNGPAPYRTDLCLALSETGCKVFHYENGDLPVRKWAGKALLKQVPSLLKREMPDWIIAPEYSPITLQLAMHRRKAGFRLLVLCDDSIGMIQGNDYSISHRVGRKIVPSLVDGIILSTPVAVDWYRARFGKGILMPIIADERRVRPELERVLSLSERLRPGEKPVVAFVGRLVGLKNIPTLIRAFEPLKDRAQLVIIGDGPLRDALEAMAPDALFTGQLSGDELLAWYNLIDILVLPSTQEAYGAVTGEALMAGAKVVVSRKAGSADLVREGENGFVVDPMDAAAITDRIGRLLDTVPSGRPVALRENLLPYRFESCIRNLLEEINAL